MTTEIEDVLVAFTARLDRAEELARAAAERPEEPHLVHGDHSVWHASTSPGQAEHRSGGVYSGAPEYQDDAQVVVYDEGYPTEAQAEHIALHDPRAVLADVAAKRKIIADYRDTVQARRDWLDDPGPAIGDPGMWLRALENVIRTLAAAYEKDGSDG